MRNAGLLEKGDDPDGEDTADYMNRLNDVVNLEQTQGLKLWLNSVVTVTLIAGVPSYSFGPAGATARALRIMEAYYLYAGGTTYPLNPLSWNSYNTLSNKSQTGMPNSFFVDKQQNNAVMTLWLVPDAVAAQGTVQALVQNQVTNLIKLDDTINFPQEWYLFLQWALADEICTGQSAEIIQRCSTKSLQYRTVLQDWDVEDGPTTFTPSHLGGGGFTRW